MIIFYNMSPFFEKKGKTVKKKSCFSPVILALVPLQGVFLPAIPWARPRPPTPCVSLEWIIRVIQLYLAMIQNLHTAHQHFIIGIAVALKMAKRSANAQFISFITSQSQCLMPSLAFELFRREVAIENVGDSKTLSTYTTDDNFDIRPFVLWCSLSCDSFMVASSLW